VYVRALAVHIINVGFYVFMLLLLMLVCTVSFTFKLRENEDLLPVCRVREAHRGEDFVLFLPIIWRFCGQSKFQNDR
jgi:hypothetical protein